VRRCTWSVVALWFALWTKFEHYLGSRAPESFRIWNGMLNGLEAFRRREMREMGNPWSRVSRDGCGHGAR
jgi:hypothetical protein